MATLDEFELHSVLVANGILVPIDAVFSLFYAADTKDNGVFSLEEFGQFVTSPASYSFIRSDLLKSILFDVDWWVNVMYTVAGLLYTIGAYPDAFSLSDVQVRDIFFSGIIMYLICGLIFFLRTPVNEYKGQKSFEMSTKKMLDTLQKKAAEYEMLPREEGETWQEDMVTQTSTEDPVDTYIREVIFAERKTLTKIDLGLFLLNSIGVHDDTILSKIFALFDGKHDGTIDVEEFQTCVKHLDPSQYTFGRRLTKVASGLLVNYDWLLNLTFLSGSLVSVLNTILKMNGSDGIWVNDNFTPSMYVMYAYTVGMIYFVTARVHVLTATRYEMRETVRNMLRNWLKSFEQDASKDWVDCDKRKFNRILEEQAIFIPKVQVDALFRDIDLNENDLLSRSELQSFVDIKREKFASMFKSTITDIMFWANWIWLIGCVLYLLALYSEGRSANVMNQVSVLSMS